MKRMLITGLLMLGLLMSLQREGAQVSSTTALGQAMMRVGAGGFIEVSARFTHELSAAERAQIQALGVEFQEVADQLAHLDRFYALRMPVETEHDARSGRCTRQQ